MLIPKLNKYHQVTVWYVLWLKIQARYLLQNPLRRKTRPLSTKRFHPERQRKGLVWAKLLTLAETNNSLHIDCDSSQLISYALITSSVIHHTSVYFGLTSPEFLLWGWYFQKQRWWNLAPKPSRYTLECHISFLQHTHTYTHLHPPPPLASCICLLCWIEIFEVGYTP